jgi:concanavalin A-like lectin/glucanase superfamily protein
MHVANWSKLLGMSIIVCGISFTCPAKDKIESFGSKLKKLSIKPSVALSFQNKKIRHKGSSEATVTLLKGEPVFVAGPSAEKALAISDQDVGVSGLDISGTKIFSATEGSFSCFFSPLAKFEDNPKQRHYFFSANLKDAGAYCYITGNTRLTLQFKETVDGKASWPCYQFDFKWNKKSGKKFEPGTWYHIVATWNADKGTLYINGVPRQKNPISHKLKAEFKNIILGAYTKKDSINSAITNVVFFDKCLTQEDIQILSVH